MFELTRTSELTEVEQLKTEGFREIRPETDMTAAEARDVWRDEVSTLRETSSEEGSASEVPETEEYAVSREDRLKQVPQEADRDGSPRGEWTGERGESTFVPAAGTESGKAAADMLAEYGLNGIEYSDAIPDFSTCCKTEVQIDAMTPNRFENYTNADLVTAERFNAEAMDGRTDWTARDVSNYRTENSLTWHECNDTHTMQLVPQEIHGYFGHSGGIAEVKARSRAEAEQAQGGTAV